MEDERTLEFVRVKFIDRMDDELVANQSKGEWNNWKPSKEDAISELMHHLNKLTKSIYKGTDDEVSEYSADVANIAMKISEEFGNS